MRRTVFRLVGIVRVPAILPGLIWLAGTSIGPAAEMRPQSNQVARLTRSGPDVCLDAPIMSSIGASGQGTLCLADSGVLVTLQVTGLADGETYTAWLSSVGSDALDLLGQDALRQDTNRLQVRFGGGIASPSGTLEVRGDRRDVRLVPGDRNDLLLLRPGGRAGPHALAIFVVP